jgi:hypothetical protein
MFDLHSNHFVFEKNPVSQSGATIVPKKELCHSDRSGEIPLNQPLWRKDIGFLIKPDTVFLLLIPKNHDLHP